MNKYILLLVAVMSISTAEITITCQESVKKYFPVWEKTEQCLKEELQPLYQTIQKITQKSNVFITCDLTVSHLFNGSFKGYELKLSSIPDCLDLSAHGTPNTAQEKLGDGSGELFIRHIEIAKKYHHRGIGKKCIQFLENQKVTQALEYKVIKLKSGSPTKGFYEKLGFSFDYKDYAPEYYYYFKKVLPYG